MEYFTTLWESFSNAERVYIICIIAYIPLMITGMVASSAVRNIFQKYSQVPSGCGDTAFNVARKMLDDNGLQHVGIQKVSGSLTDNYDPRYDMVSLSESVYNSNSVSAIAVACHECGHAVQHDQKYPFSTIRIKLVPVLNFTNKLIFPLIIVGLLLQFLIIAFAQFALIFYIAGSVLFGLSMIFSLITLPTEFDASKRAKEYIAQFVSSEEAVMSKKVLSAAAMTYVISFLISLVQFLRFFTRLLMLTKKR